MNENYMSGEDIYNAITELSYSQGFYGRIKARIDELGEDGMSSLNELAETGKFHDVVDLVMFLEC